MATRKRPRGIAGALVGAAAAASLSVAAVAGPALAATIDLAPSRMIVGAATDLSGPLGNATDAAGNLYVTNYYTGSVTIYDAAASGNTAPARTLTGGLTGPAGVALDGSANIYVADMGAATLAVYDHGASGAATPIRAISGSNTGLSGPYGIALDGTGSIYVTDPDNNSIRVFGPGASGNVAPVRIISGANTGLVTPKGLGRDSDGNLYVTSADNSIRIFGPAASGNTAPDRIIKGASTGMSNPIGLTIDPARNIYAASVGNDAITVFPAAASGNATPTTTIMGPSTRMNGPMGLGMDSAGRIYASNFVVSTVTVYSLQVPQTITFPALPDTAFSAAPPVPTATASSGLPVSYSSLTPTVCTTSAGGAIAFIAAGPCTIAANQSGNATWTAAPQVTRTFQITPAKQHQEPTTACVRNPTVGRIPVAGTFSLMTEPCATNAGQRVGVTVSAQLRGDARYFSLYCKVSPTKATATRRTGYPDRSVYCPRGTLKIRTYGYHLRIRVRWHAPATASFTAYLQQRNYRT